MSSFVRKAVDAQNKNRMTRLSRSRQQRLSLLNNPIGKDQLEKGASVSYDFATDFEQHGTIGQTSVFSDSEVHKDLLSDERGSYTRSLLMSGHHLDDANTMQQIQGFRHFQRSQQSQSNRQQTTTEMMNGIAGFDLNATVAPPALHEVTSVKKPRKKGKQASKKKNTTKGQSKKGNNEDRKFNHCFHSLITIIFFNVIFCYRHLHSLNEDLTQLPIEQVLTFHSLITIIFFNVIFCYCHLLLSSSSLM